jgi:hypothetical protein
MKTKLSLTRFTCSLLLGVLSCSAPLPTFARQKEERRERGERFGQELPRENIARLETRSQLPGGRRTVSRAYVRQRLDWLKVNDPRHFKTHAYFETLIEAGYDPVLLDGWLDGLYDDVVVVGMPGDLVLDYYGEPVFRREVVYAGAPAFEWGVQLTPGRVETVTVAHGKVVRVHG